MFGILYHQILYRPLLNALVFLYQGIPYHDLGIAIILLTIIIRVILYPFVARSMKAQKALALIQPEIKSIQEKYSNNKEEQAKKLMELYKERGVSPFSGCLPILIQLPLLIALYQVFASVAHVSLATELYSFVPHPSSLSLVSFHIINLSLASIPLAILAGVSQFFQAYGMPSPTSTGSDASFQRALQTQTLYVLPIFIAIIAFKLPAALPLYWTVLNVLGILQQKFLT